jgi:hypothetical protein
MDFTPEPANQARLLPAFRRGALDDPVLATTCANRDLLLREHALTCLYWFKGENPVRAHLLHRHDEVLPTKLTREQYLKHYAIWGQQISQARLEGLAIPVQEMDYIVANLGITPPPFHYPTVALDFVLCHYRPIAAGPWNCHVQDVSVGAFPAKINHATVRARELSCLLGIFIEASLQDPFLGNYTRFLERTFFALLAFNPVVRLGLPQPFGHFVRESVTSLAAYLYMNEEQLRGGFDLPRSFYYQLLECIAELANLLPHIGACSSEDCV